MRAFLQHPRLRSFPMHRDLAILVLVVIGCAVPFLAQPFHMDDNFYMDMARNARAHPLFPYDAPYDFGGGHAPDTASHSHPPLQSYFLAVVQHFAGEGPGTEWVYHSVYLLFPLLATISCYFLAARFLERPIWPSLGLAAAPLFMVMGHSLMTDVPMLAFWLAATATFLWATELDCRHLFAASALFMFAAMFTSYQAASLIPLLAFYQIRSRGRTLGWAALLFPLAAMIGWLTMSSVHYGRMVLGDTVGYVQSHKAATVAAMLQKATALLEYQGWLILFPFFLIYIFGRGLRGRLFALLLLVSLYIVQMQAPGYRLADKAIFIIGWVTGALVVLPMLRLLWSAFGNGKTAADGFSTMDSQFITLWYFGVATYCLVLFTGGSARYILPLVPPVLILFFRRLEIREVAEYRAEKSPLLNSAMVASGSLVLSLAWGLFLAQADFEFARIYPRAADAFSRVSSGLNAFVTGEWGFRYYLGQAGARPLPEDETSVAGGSLLVKPQLAMPFDAPTGLSTMTLPFARLSFDVKTPFRTMDVHSPAGFYSSAWGWLPFSFSSESVEVLDIRQVSFLIERLPWARIRTSSGVKPWPGFAFIHENVLALLVKPGTRLEYPWSFRRPMYLKLQVGVQRDPGKTDDTIFDFEILLRDGQGKILARFQKSLGPAMQWEPVDLLLDGGISESTLELSYAARSRSDTVGAFAGAVIVPK
jgi:hypothetical protein